MSETIGQRLKQTRLARHISIEAASEATRIRLRYLESLETDDYSVMPSAAQARGFLRNYATFLGLDLDQVLSEIQRAQAAELPEDVSGPLPHVDAVSLPPQVSAPVVADESPRTPPFWTSWLARLRKPNPSPEPIPAQEPTLVAEVIIPEPEPQAEPPAPIEAPIVQEEPKLEEAAPKKRGRKKKEPPAPPPSASSEPPTRPTKKASKKKDESVREAVEVAEAPEPPVEEEIKAEVATPLIEEERPQVQPEAEEESQSGFWTRLQSIFKLRVKNVQEDSLDEEKSQAEAPLEILPDLIPTETGSPQSVETPKEIFIEIGARLRQRREMLSLTMDEIERHTHVRAAFVKALEEGDFDQLPSAVQTRGMLANYATFLDLDTDALLLRFADALQARHRARYSERPRAPRTEMKLGQSLPPLRTFIAGDMLFGIGMAVMLVALGIWGFGRVFANQAARSALPTAPSISDILARTPVSTAQQEVTLIPAAATPSAVDETTTTPDVGTELPTEDANANVQVEIMSVSSTFMRVLVDGKEKFSGRTMPDTNYPFDAATSVQILTGNAAALRVTYNGKNLGLLGSFGEVVNLIYSANSITTPTPEATATSTATPNIPATVTQTFTPTPSSTPTPTPVSQ
ncbi:MAG TPA: RodZ domain-containing protein [Anaerolineales bacterium]|nr:RodZ domain-containing protein [Anaerolineales bacterium]